MEKGGVSFAVATFGDWINGMTTMWGLRVLVPLENLGAALPRQLDLASEPFTP